jgi:hypothetical protein
MFGVLRQLQHGIFALLGIGAAWLGVVGACAGAGAGRADVKGMEASL